jgi:hypothetical protein
MGFLLLLAVSYSRDIAPILAMHCNRCHGDSGTAGGLVTRTHDDLMKPGDAIVPGDPDRSQVVQFIEGRRGEEHRMPLGSAPLKGEQIALIRRWIAEGAKADAVAPVTHKVSISKIRIGRREPLRIEGFVPVPAYLIMNVIGGGRILFERRATVKSPREMVTWTVWPEKGWPGMVEVELSVLYAEIEPRKVGLRVKSGKKIYTRE